MANVTDYFYNGGLNCAESTLRLLIERGVIDAPIDAVRMMTPFGGGMQRGATCGAVVAALAAIGWKYGRTEADRDRAPSAKAARDFLTRFEEAFGSLDCRTLRTNAYAPKSDGMYRSCTVYVERALALAEEIIKEDR